MSAAAGFVSTQFGPAGSAQNVVIGEREYSSNHYPWRLQAAKGYEIRQVPFGNGGLEPDDIARRVDRGTVLVAFSGAQTATGHRSDIRGISAIARAVGAVVFVDGTQLVGALPVAAELDAIAVLAPPDHKFLLHAGRGLGYCYLSREMQTRFTPIFDAFGAEAIFDRNRELAALLRSSLHEIGWEPVALPEANRSSIVSVPMRDTEPAQLVDDLKRHGIVCSARGGNLRFAIHFYNHEDDILRVTDVLARIR